MGMGIIFYFAMEYQILVVIGIAIVKETIYMG